MKKLLPIILILVFSACKKEQINPSQTQEFSIKSTSNGGSYNIKVAIPADCIPTEKYSTIYVLDGEENFEFVAANTRKISGELCKSNVLVVSIGYGNDRALDYTPTKAKEGGGGAKQFMEFINNELIPKIEKEYNVDTARHSRTMLGHSFGGLLTAYAFTNYNSVFGNYIMLSPSLWYDNEILLKLEQENRQVNQNRHQLVFMGLGELENSGRMLAPYKVFLNRLENNYPGIKLSSNLEPQQSHVGSKNPNIIKALKFYFLNKQSNN